MKSGWSSERDLLVGLNRGSGLRESIERSVRAAIRDGRLALGAVLPSSRSLAGDLGVARGTVSAAYAQLAAEGYLGLRQGAAPRVCWAPEAQFPPAPSRKPDPRPLWDLRPDYLTCSAARAVLVTPAHQYPLGVTMSAARRIGLVEWARRCKAVIIEDDYDGEFRYDRQPVGALQHLDPEHVIYVGTASKTLAPGLRLGWLSPPAAMSEALRTSKEHLDRGTSTLEQLTFAELIASGSFDRHIRRMRGIYRRRRDELAEALTRAQPGLRLAGIAAGLHALAYLPEHGPSERWIRDQATQRSLALGTLSSYWHNPPQPLPQAIIIGYATPAGHAYHPTLAALTQLLTSQKAPRPNRSHAI